MTFGSLFSGIGGMDLGLERAGMTCRWQVEIDPFRRRVLARHWPHVRRFSDIVEVFSHDLERVDCVAGGFPCKQTSNAAAIHGRRNGLAGVQSGLWAEQYLKTVSINPTWAIVENVGGVKTWAPQITADLERVGYTVSRLDCTAAGVGAPHLRTRVFFVANRDGKRLEEPWPSGPSEAEGEQGRAADGNHWLSSLPGVLRVDDGVPARLDRRGRISAIGDSVVPQVAEWIGRRILEASA